jgi:hypothetical protein
VQEKLIPCFFSLFSEGGDRIDRGRKHFMCQLHGDNECSSHGHPGASNIITLPANRDVDLSQCGPDMFYVLDKDKIALE